MLAQPIIGLLLLQTPANLDECNHQAFAQEQRQRRGELTTRLKELISESREISEQRMAIAERLVELAEGRHRLKGLVDPNYNADSLRSRDKALASKLDLIGQEGRLIQAEDDLLRMDAENFRLTCGQGAVQQ